VNRALIVTEGKDDIRALREIFTRMLGLTAAREGTQPFGRDQETLVKPDIDYGLLLLPAGDRDRAAQFTRTFVAEGKLARNGVGRVAIAFDPDGHTDEQCESWLRKAAVDETWGVQPCELAYRVSTPHGDLELIPLAWDGGCAFNDLPGYLRSVERVAMGILQTASPEDSSLLLELLSVLQGRGRSLSWKTAFRLLNAVRKPDAEDGFIAQVFGQDRELRTGVLPVLQETRLWRRLCLLAGGNAPGA
jgi:hypothetical protein